MRIGLLAVALQWSVSAVAGDSARISRFELLNNLVIEGPQKALGLQQATNIATTTVSFEASGRVIVLDLVRNDRLVAKIRTRLQLTDDELTVYKGTMRSIPGSWARVSIDGGQLSGVIWDGADLLLIDRIDRLEGISAAGVEKDRFAVVRAADIELPIDDGVHLDKLLHSAVTRAKTYAATVGPDFGAISLGIVIGDGVDGSVGGEEVQAAIEWANIVDGLFTEQVDIHLDLEHIENLTGMPNLFASTDPSALLTELRNMKSSNANLSGLGLTHLVTRNDLDGTTRGTAMIASACGPAAGVGLTEIRGGNLDALIMAHEIGHNLGAPHDNEEGSACEATPGSYLMAPIINSSSTFSPCSIAHLTTFLNSASCLVAVAGSEIELERPVITGPIYYKDRIDVDVNIHNTGAESIVDSQLDVNGSGVDLIISHGPERNCTQQNWSSQKICDLDNLYAGETVTLETKISPQATGLQTVNYAVSAANDTDPTNNSYLFELDVQPAIEANATGINITDRGTIQGGIVRYNVIAQNMGDFETTAVVHLQVDPVHTLRASAQCVSPEPGKLDCDVGLVEAGGNQSFEIELQAGLDLGLGIADVIEGDIDLDLTTSVFNTFENSSGQFNFYVFGAAHFIATGFVDVPVSIDQDTSGEFVAYLTNLGPDPIPDSRFNIERTPGIELQLVTVDRGVCTPNGNGIGCEMGQFEPGEVVNLTVAYTGVDAGAHQIGLMAIPIGGLNLTGAYPTAFAEFDVILPPPPPPPPPPPSPPPNKGGGGGGSTSLLWLLIMAASRLLKLFVIKLLSTDSGFVHQSAPGNSKYGHSPVILTD